MDEKVFTYTREERESLIRAMQEVCERLKAVRWKQLFMLFLGIALAILTVALARRFNPNRDLGGLANAVMSINGLWIAFWIPNVSAAFISVKTTRECIAKFEADVPPDGGTADYDFKRNFVYEASNAADAGFRPFLVWVKRSAR